MILRTHLVPMLIGVGSLSAFTGARNGTSAQQPTPSTTGQPMPASDARSGLMLQRSERLSGVEVGDSARQRIGRIEDFLLRADGTIAYAVLASADSQTKLYPVPWSALTIEQPTVADATKGPDAARPQSVVLGATKNRMANAPSFDRGRWPKDDEATVFTEADRHFGTVHPSSDTSTSNAVAAREDVLFRASTLHNQAVNGSDNDLVGSLDTVLFDTTSGRVCYVTLALPGGRLVGLPWGALQPNRREGKNDFRTSATAEQLKSAPQFKSGDEQWKVMSDPTWVRELYAYYSLRPYWHDPHAPVVPRN